MRRKIEWYQEVLALEPGSRVFFPLARLFAEHGELEDAERTLRLGLDRHPDALEARLLLVEVLTRLGRQEEALEQTLLAVKPLERYPAFWTHWAREHAATNRDFSMFLLLVASQFSDKPAKWADVVLEGLHSFAERLNVPAGTGPRRIRPQAQARPAAESRPVQPPLSRPVEGAGFEAPAQAAGQGAVPPSFAQAAALLAAAPKVEAAPLEDAPFAPAYVPPAYVAPAAAPYATSGAAPAFAPSPEAAPVTAFAAAPSWGGQPAPAAAPAAARNGETGLDAPYEGPAPDAKSFRTRTMAELLATQGDFGGALGIYRELWGRSHDAQEKAELTSRIQRLEEDLAAAPEPEAAPKPVVQEDPFGKHAKNRLMSTLEALAARLEARVQA